MLLNQEIPAEKQIRLKFSNGWLEKLNNRNHFKCYRSHEESGNVDQTVVNKEIPALREKLKKYSLKDIWNADEFGLFYQMPPRNTIAPGSIPGRKKNGLPACQFVMPMGVKKCLCLLLEGQKILNAFMEKIPRN